MSKIDQPVYQRRVLVIAYYFPPMGLSGVQRTLKFVKYFSDFGWHSTVLTITPKSYYAFDETLLTDLAGKQVDFVRTNSIDPEKVFKKRKTRSFQREWLRKILNRISQFFFIPDNKITWKRKAIKFGMETLEKQEHQLIFSTAPPYTDHLIGVELKKRTGIPLVLDFRDAWIDNPYHFYWTPFHYRWHLHFERKVIQAANLIITINRSIKEKLVSRHRDLITLNHVKVVSQGYDQEDFTKYSGGSPVYSTKKMQWLYTGVFYEQNTPVPLYKALAEIKKSHPEILQNMVFHMVGFVQNDFVNMTKALNIYDLFIYHSYMDHQKVIRWMSQADALWLSLGIGKGYETISTGKIYEYIGSGKRILAITPDNEAAKTLKPFPQAKIIDPGLIDSIKTGILTYYQDWFSGNPVPKPLQDLQLKYERKQIAYQLTKEFNMIVETTI